MDNIYLLRRINRSGISTFRFSLITMTGGLCLAAALLYFGLQEPAVPGFGSMLLPAITSILVFMGSAFTCLALYFVRNNVADMVALTKDHPALTDLLNSIVLTRFFQLGLLLILITTYYGAFITVEFNMFPERTLPERWQRITGTLVPATLYFVATPILTLGAWLFTAVVLQQHLMLMRLARQLPIRISQLINYQPISNPFVRMVIVFSLMSTLFPVVLLTSDVVPTEAVVMASFSFGSFLVISSLYFAPVVVLRNRIRDVANKAQLALAQDMAATDLTEVEHDRLMMRQMYLESRWEWPIASNVQRIIVFGLLPPAAWVMAAIVENVLF